MAAALPPEASGLEVVKEGPGITMSCFANLGSSSLPTVGLRAVFNEKVRARRGAQTRVLPAAAVLEASVHERSCWKQSCPGGQ